MLNLFFMPSILVYFFNIFRSILFPLIATGSDDGFVGVFEYGDSLNQCAMLRHHSKPVTCVAFSSCGSYLASASLDMDVCVW